MERAADRGLGAQPSRAGVLPKDMRPSWGLLLGDLRGMESGPLSLGGSSRWLFCFYKFCSSLCHSNSGPHCLIWEFSL